MELFISILLCIVINIIICLYCKKIRTWARTTSLVNCFREDNLADHVLFADCDSWICIYLTDAICNFFGNLFGWFFGATKVGRYSLIIGTYIGQIYILSRLIFILVKY